MGWDGSGARWERGRVGWGWWASGLGWRDEEGGRPD